MVAVRFPNRKDGFCHSVKSNRMNLPARWRRSSMTANATRLRMPARNANGMIETLSSGHVHDPTTNGRDGASQP